ncbi:MAG: hypothetical protein E6I78_11385, partial [Chloroflexi bacterium]
MQLLPRPGTAGFPTAAYAAVTLNGTLYVLQPISPASNINTWVYWVLTRHGATLTLYRNGVQIAQRTDLPATATVSLNGYIANENNGNYYLAGSVQDVAAYNVALASDEVENAYVAGLNAVPPPPPAVYPVAPTNLTAVPSASTVRLTWTDGDTTSSYWLYRGTDPNFTNPVTISLPPGTASYTDTGLGQGVVYYKLVASNTGGNSPALLASAATTSYTALVAGRTALLGHWRLSDTTGTTAWDTTGTYNGVYVNSPTLGSPGAIARDPSTSVTFNGSTQRVNLPILPSAAGDFAIEGWTYLTNASVNNNTIFGSGTLQFLARPGTGSFPTAAYAAVTLNGTVYALQPTSPASNINAWVYWVMSRQGGTLTLYRNGVQIAQRTDLPATATTSLSGYIANESNGSYYLTGRVQDVAVYTRALSSGDVANGYTAATNGLAPGSASASTTPYYNAVRSEPSLLAYWRLGESSGTTATDVLGRSNGTYVNSPALGAGGPIANDPDTATTFNGSTQRVNLPLSPTVTDYSIEGWTYLTNGTVNNNTLYGNASTVQLLARPGNATFPTAAYAGVTLNATAYVLQPNSTAPNTNIWVYWVVTRQGATLTLYRNAVQIAQRTDLPATATTTLNGYIAAEPSGAYYLTGQIDEVALYTSALTPQAVTGHYQAALNGPTPHPTAPPSATVTQPANGATYGANWPGSVTGTASTNSGFSLTGTSVALFDTTTGKWWGGSAFNQSSPTYLAASGTTSWSLSFAAGNLTSGHGYTATAQATDSVGNTGTSAAVGFTYNTAPPNVAIGYPANNGIYGANWTGSINGTASSTSGFALTSASVAVLDTTTGQWWGGFGFNRVIQTFVPVTSGISAWSMDLAAVNLTSGHGYTVTGQATDSLGNTGTSTIAAFTYKTTAPSTAIACNGTSCSSGWYNAPVSVTLAATDNSGGAGIGGIYYTTNGSAPTTSSPRYTGAFTVSTTSLVQFFSVDNAGNAEAVKSQAVQIDTVAPATSAACNAAACSASYYNAPVSVTLPATDNPGGSGVSATYYTTDGSTPTTSSLRYAGAITLGGTGTIRYFSVDGAANSEAVKSQLVQIDTTAPTTTIACNGAACSSAGYDGSVSVTLSPSDDSGGSGVSATYYTTDGSTPTTSSTAYSGAFTLSRSSTVQFFTIDRTGNAEAVKQQAITVRAVLVSIAVTPTNPSIPKGTLQSFSAMGTYSDGSTRDLTGSVTWASANAAVATITSGGLASGASQGSAQISATSGSLSGTTTLTVGPAILVSVTVGPANPAVAKGTTQSFTATGGYSDGSTQDLTSSATWASSNQAVATITATGLASGVAQGSSQISATSGGVTGATTLTVTPATLLSIAVSPANPSIPKGTTQAFAATGTYSDGSTSDLSSSVTWASSATAVATMTTGGLASGVAQGSAQITATSGGVTGGTTLTVGPAVLVSIAVTPSNPSVAKGTTQQFTATGTSSDGSTSDLSSSVTWASSATAVATISSGGLASGMAQGSSQITASSGGVTG